MDPLELLRGTAQPSYGAIKNGEDDDSGGDLAAFVSKLATKSPKAKSTPKASGTAKRRIRPQTSAVSAESEYAVMQTGGGDQLSVDALLGSSGAVTDKSVASVLSPEAAAKPRASNVVEERVTRKAAYSSKASELDRWNQSIKVNRQHIVSMSQFYRRLLLYVFKFTRYLIIRLPATLATRFSNVYACP
jgi:U3 small nucleolar RNA-associated protein 14